MTRTVRWSPAAAARTSLRRRSQRPDAEVLESQIHARAPARTVRLNLVLQRLGLVAVIVAVWWLLALRVPHYVLPGPTRVWDALKLIAANGNLWQDLGITLGRVGTGFVLATLVGLPLGIIFGANRASAISSSRSFR